MYLSYMYVIVRYVIMLKFKTLFAAVSPVAASLEGIPEQRGRTSGAALKFTPEVLWYHGFSATVAALSMCVLQTSGARCTAQRKVSASSPPKFCAGLVPPRPNKCRRKRQNVLSALANMLNTMQRCGFESGRPRYPPGRPSRRPASARARSSWRRADARSPPRRGGSRPRSRGSREQFHLT